ncbi:MAG: carboxypeptidase regulatory-like domain-containing protein [Polyangiales bacterium]
MHADRLEPRDRGRAPQRLPWARGARWLVVLLAVLFAVIVSARRRPARWASTGATIEASTVASPDQPTLGRARLAPDLASGGSLSGSVLAPNGAPISGALVCADATSPAYVDDEIRDATCVLSDDAGHWSIAPVVAATYTIDATAAQMHPTRFVDREGGTTIPIAAGEARYNVDLTLFAGAVEVKGRVVDLAGGGIAHALVTLTGKESGRSGGEARTRCDGAGNFSAWIDPGPFDANAASDGFVTEWSAGVAPATQLEIVLAPGATIVGRVVAAETGAPVAGAKVSASPFGPEGGLAEAASTRSGADGRFSLDRLEAGKWRTSAEVLGALGEAAGAVRLAAGETSKEVTIVLHPGHVVAGQIVVVEDDSTSVTSPCVDGSISLQDLRRGRFFNASTAPDGHVALTLPFEGRFEVSVRCTDAIESTPSATLIVTGDATDNTWRVRRGRAIRGVALDAAGHPLARVQVEARRTDRAGLAHEAFFGEDTTGPDGRFVITGIEPGNYSIDATTNEAKSPATQTVQVDTSGAAPEIKLVFERGRSLAGLVVDEDGVGVAGLTVSVDNANLSPKSAETDETGHFSVGGLDAVDHTITATREGIAVRGAGGVEPASTTVTATTTSTGLVRLVVERMAGELRGRVVDATGHAVVGASIEVSREPSADAAERLPHPPARSDQDGNFVVRRLPTATLTVRARARVVGGPVAIANDVAPGSQVTLTMPTGATLSGSAVDKEGRAPESLSVSLESDTRYGLSPSGRFLRTGGLWTLDGIAPGEYTVQVVSADGEAIEHVVIAEGDIRTFASTLQPVATVTGCVLWQDDGRPAGGVEVASRTAASVSTTTRWSHATTDATGCFQIARAPMGSVTIHVTDAESGEDLGSRAVAIDQVSIAVGVVRVTRPRPPIQIVDEELTHEGIDENLPPGHEDESDETQ